MIAEAFGLGVGAALPKWACYMIVLGPVIIFTIACYISGDGELQLMLATWFSLGFSFIMACVLIGIIIEGVNFGPDTARLGLSVLHGPRSDLLSPLELFLLLQYASH